MGAVTIFIQEGRVYMDVIEIHLQMSNAVTKGVLTLSQTSPGFYVSAILAF